MRLFRNRGPSGAELVRQTQVRRLLCKYGAYSRQVSSKSSSSLECSSSVAQSRSSKLASSSSIELASATSRRAAQMLSKDSDLNVPMSKPSQLLSSWNLGQMDKGLALAAAQYVSRILASGEAEGMDAQQLKEDFLHQLERDWGFAGAESLSLGRIKITIKRRDNELENFRRRAEQEKAALEKNRLMQEEGVQLRSRRVQAVSSSSQQVQSSTKVVKTRVVKTVRRTVQTVRAA